MRSGLNIGIIILSFLLVATSWSSSAQDLTDTAIPAPSLPKIPGSKEHLVVDPVSNGETYIYEAGMDNPVSIILIHGVGDEGSINWRHLIPMLAKQYHVVTFDLPGFGRSPAADIEPAAVLNEAIKQTSQEKVILLGPSMGGRVALEFTLANPGLVTGLVLVGAVGVQENQARLKELSLPCLAVWGGEDSISPLANGRLIEQEVKGAELAVITGAPHPCYLDQPDEWHRVLLGFLRENFPVK